jgi:hypothetical protein
MPAKRRYMLGEGLRSTAYAANKLTAVYIKVTAHYCARMVFRV